MTIFEQIEFGHKLLETKKFQKTIDLSNKLCREIKETRMQEVDYLEVKFQILIMKVIAQGDIGNIHESIETAKKLISIAKSQKKLDNLGTAYYYLGFATWNNEEYQNAVVNFEKSIDNFTKHGDADKLGEAYFRISGFLISASVFDISTDYLLKSITCFEKSKNNYKKAECFDLLAHLYLENEEFNKSENYLSKSLMIFKEIKLPLEVSRVYSNIGYLNFLKKKYKKAIKYFHKSLEVSESVLDNASLEITYANLADAYLNSKNYNKAIHYFDLSKNIIEKQGGKETEIAKILWNTGIAHFGLKEFQNSINSYLHGIELIENTDNFALLSIMYEYLAYAYYIIRKYSESEDSYKNAIQLAHKLDNKERLADLYFKLANLYSRMKMFEKAISNYEIVKVTISDFENNHKIITSANKHIKQMQKYLKKRMNKSNSKWGFFKKNGL
jgi:tetratricopeptide (TPR) repeat protein